MKTEMVQKDNMTRVNGFKQLPNFKKQLCIINNLSIYQQNVLCTIPKKKRQETSKMKSY